MPNRWCSGRHCRVMPMTEGDLEPVMAIEAQTVGPWSGKQLADELQQPFGWQFVARTASGEGIVGYICGRTVAAEAEILKVAVVPAWRSHGVGSRLITHVLHFLADRKVERCHLELRRSNGPALQLYKKFKFKQTATRRNYYADPLEDAIVMTRKFSTPRGTH